MGNFEAQFADPRSIFNVLHLFFDAKRKTFGGEGGGGDIDPTPLLTIIQYFSKIPKNIIKCAAQVLTHFSGITTLQMLWVLSVCPDDCVPCDVKHSIPSSSTSCLSYYTFFSYDSWKIKSRKKPGKLNSQKIEAAGKPGFILDYQGPGPAPGGQMAILVWTDPVRPEGLSVGGSVSTININY